MSIDNSIIVKFLTRVHDIGYWCGEGDGDSCGYGSLNCDGWGDGYCQGCGSVNCDGYSDDDCDKYEDEDGVSGYGGGDCEGPDNGSGRGSK